MIDWSGDDPQAVGRLVEELELAAHPEGGYYKEIYRDSDHISARELNAQSSANFAGNRTLMTAIYFLLPAGTYSALHRIKANELWLHLAGGPLAIHEIDEAGDWHTTTLDRAQGKLDHLVPRGRWFGSEPAAAQWSLVSCLCAPGFDFADFELADQNLTKAYPNWAKKIEHLLPGAR